MKKASLGDLQESVRDTTAFGTLKDYLAISLAFLRFVKSARPSRIISPSHANYSFFQYGSKHAHRITRPLNTDLFIESPAKFKKAFERLTLLLDDLRVHGGKAARRTSNKDYIRTKEVNKVVYTVQQSIGCIGDSFENPNQSRKRVGQLFENLVILLIRQVGLDCEPRTIQVPIPGYPAQKMSYQLDLVFSRDKAIIASETKLLHTSEVVGSVKTTSKDRIDKVFLDKYLLSKLLGRNVRLVAVFLHDVQRARRGSSIFGINSTFKSNHFLAYSVALNSLDGVYYVDPRPNMEWDVRLREQIRDFQHFLVADLWRLSGPGRRR